MKKTKDSAGTDAPSGQSSLEGTRASLSNRFIARIRKYTGWESSLRSDAGAAMVEMAFIFSILVMLLVGVVTSAIAFGQKNSIENAAREASRYAATLPEAWLKLDDVVDVALKAAQGELDADVEGQYICVAHTGHDRMLEVIGGVVFGPTGGKCYEDDLSDSRVQVQTGRQSQINAALFSVDINLEAKASARYERAES